MYNGWVKLKLLTADSIACCTAQRQPWSDEHLRTLFTHEIWQKGKLPDDKKAGGLDTSDFEIPPFLRFPANGTREGIAEKPLI